jgi:hypothetical protein
MVERKPLQTAPIKDVALHNLDDVVYFVETPQVSGDACDLITSH